MILNKFLKLFATSDYYWFQEDLDLKVLKIQNKNLSEKLLKRKRQEEELKEKLDGLQNRKLIDDNKLCIMDRYWTQLDEDLRLILERFDNTSAENSKLKEPNDKKSSSPAIRNFLSKLNDWDRGGQSKGQSQVYDSNSC